MKVFDLTTKSDYKSFEEWIAGEIKDDRALVKTEVREIYLKQDNGSVESERKMCRVISIMPR